MQNILLTGIRSPPLRFRFFFSEKYWIQIFVEKSTQCLPIWQRQVIATRFVEGMSRVRMVFTFYSSFLKLNILQEHRKLPTIILLIIIIITIYNIISCTKHSTSEKVQVTNVVIIMHSCFPHRRYRWEAVLAFSLLSSFRFQCVCHKNLCQKIA